ncbi:CO dehydrogenase/acetyl-CoA synthase subunit delta [Methanopyrus kandleri]
MAEDKNVKNMLEHLMKNLLVEDIEEIELRNVTIELDELELDLKTVAQTLPAEIWERILKPEVEEKVEKEVEIPEYEPPVEEYEGCVAEVQIGATRSDGGSRDRVVVLGGERAYFPFEEPRPNPPVVTFDVFDTPDVGIPGPIREELGDVIEDPVDWARTVVKRYGVDIVTVHLVSTSPKLHDAPVEEAMETLEDILDAVKVPIIVGGSGDPEKDVEVFVKAAEVCEGERVMLSSINEDMDFERVVEAAKEHGHVVLTFAPVDVNLMKSLNKKVLNRGLSKEDVVMDPTTCALGYGIEYTIDVMTRIRLAALKGDEHLQMPISSGSTNAWAAREAWMKEESWGPREYRGPLWEAVTATTVALCGADLLMMFHPWAVQVVMEAMEYMAEGRVTGDAYVTDVIA